MVLSWTLAVVLVMVAAAVVVVVWPSDAMTTAILAGSCMILGVIPVPHVHTLAVSAGVTPGGGPIINFHFATNRRWRWFIPACGLISWILVAS